MIREATKNVTELAEELRPILIRAARELRRETESLGVATRHVTLISRVQSDPGLSLRELAGLEGISAPALSDHVDRLEEAGYVVRVRAADDRRRVGLELTPAGESLLRRVRARRTTWLVRRLDSIAGDDLTAIEAALPALRTLLAEEPR
ncbi:MAG: winged helix-turn-helix domain-containing protein [Gaiellales bacterium]